MFTTSGGITPFQRLGAPGLEMPLTCRGSEIMAMVVYHSGLSPWSLGRLSGRKRAEGSALSFGDPTQGNPGSPWRW